VFWFGGSGMADKGGCGHLTYLRMSNDGVSAGKTIELARESRSVGMAPTAAADTRRAVTVSNMLTTKIGSRLAGIVEGGCELWLSGS
jgi:hypothetical protein